MMGDRGLGEAQCLHEIPYAEFAAPEQPQDLLPMVIRQGMGEANRISANGDVSRRTSEIGSKSR